MGARPSLYSVLPRLFQGIAALGCRPHSTAHEVSKLPLGPSCSIIDLACGKGAVSLILAQSIGCQVLGIDACEEFINEAREQALAMHLSRNCQFAIKAYQDIKPVPRYDVAMMIGLLPAPLAAPLIRQFVPLGGHYVVDDCIRLDAGSPPAASQSTRKVNSTLIAQIEAAPTRAMIEDSIKSLGDSIVSYCPESTRDASRRLMALEVQLAANIKAIVQSHPKHKATLKHYMEYQTQARLLLSGPLRSAFWIVRRGESLGALSAAPRNVPRSRA